MSSTTDLIDAQLAAYRARDLETFLTFYSDEVIIRDVDGNVLMQGVQGMREFYGPLFDNSPDLQVDTPRRIDFGDFVIDEELVTGINLDGYPPQLHASAAYRVTESKISAVTFLM